MTILTMCVDQERGKYMAISAEDPNIRCFSYISENEALGNLVAANSRIVIDKVVGECDRERTA